ncbi:MAG: hypothetical protein ACRD8W_09930 [Nitrososphaeraceae archaeon]
MKYGETRDDLKFNNLIKPLLFATHEKFFEANEQEIFGPDLAFKSSDCSLKLASKVTYFC